MAKGETRVVLEGRELDLSNLTKVLFPETGFTKGELIEYYVTIGPVMLAHIADRAVTMKRFPDGVDRPYFYGKNAPGHAPNWVRTVAVPASDGGDGVEYPLLDSLPALAWAANLAAIEIHVPLWQLGRRRKFPGPPDLMVFDLDPGEGTSVVQCCVVAELVRALLVERGYEPFAKTSGSKGLQVYVALSGSTSWDKTRSESHEIATQLEREHPDLVVSNMRKSLRRGRVLIDWSQNHRSKTTVAAYSVRGRERPTVSTPVSWEEVASCAAKDDPSLLEFTTADVLDRVAEDGDLFSGVGHAPPGHVDSAVVEEVEEALSTYRAKRDPSRTPEPMAPTKRRKKGESPRFVVQEHHARALHWDFRLEHDGVLASWALPKGVPMDPKTNHLAVRTEDHPLSYESFEGEIPAGEYGGGQVHIWDRGTYELEKWQEKEVMVVLQGERVSGRYVLFSTGGKNWMIHRMDPSPDGFAALPAGLRPMLATPADLPRRDDGWAYEIKWDGVRALAYIDGGRVHLQSRNDNELTDSFPEFRTVGEQLGARPCILDGEIVTMGDDGLPDFQRLQHRLHGKNAATARKQAEEWPAIYVVFDVLHLDGVDLMNHTYDERREVLEGLALSGSSISIAASYREAVGADILEGTRQSGLEGVIAKRRDSRYLPGVRSDAWLKVKNVRTQEVVIGGWTEGSGERSDDMGALLLGLPEGNGLRFVGKVGTGFGAVSRRELLSALHKLEVKKSPFVPPESVNEKAPHHFVRPRLVGEVQFSDWTTSGRLRHPTWRGLRKDKDPRDVTVE